ncbi:inner membrane-spanning protein YciB [Sphingomonas sp.]|uniref:inner membrane-spanning protein YciB n=1 Tax=Sphingomonas sp. TaxID=28214 RepID=UPI0025FAB42A|nr:inner membrane-spanning protein YciB [Sphingomonas sp.]
MTETKPHPGWTLAIDYGPLVVFFLGVKFGGVFAATGLFMIAIVLALLISKFKLGRVSPMLGLSAILVVGFGGLTLYFHDIRFIQHKPTVIYLLLGGLLMAGWLMGRPLLKYVLEAGYDGLTDKGWMILSRNWAWFFIAMAAINEILVFYLTPEMWITVKVWGGIALSFLFALANVPVMTKHGFGDTPTVVPPEG